MQKQLKQQQVHDQFQEAQEQVLTYVLSEQIGTSPAKHTKKFNPKYSQKHKLELVMTQKQPVKEFNFKDANKNIKKIQEHQGKIIKIGLVTFRSNFQCGNINAVRLVAHNTYLIDLQKQTNANRISGWFYFNVQGIKGQANFIIRGFTKTSSLYNEGMKICYRDAKEMTKWRRGGTRIVYTISEDDNEEQKGYELRFSYFFKNTQITCIQFAYCFPYGLKKLSNLLNYVRESAEVRVLGRSFMNQNIPLLLIGNKQSQKVIILSARVHPGQTVSSFIMQGFLKQLVGQNQYGKILRSYFLFKIVPMLNPDGVVRGNYRFSGYGCDLNRKWKSCKQSYHPQIYFMRQLIRQTNKQKKVVMYIDMHGHSRKKNVFFYGCSQKKGGDVNTRPKQFPFIMEKLHDAYKYQNCCFAIQKDKQGTARITTWKDLRIDYVYTLQSSFCGAQYGPNYLQADYQKIGKKLCEGITCLFHQQLQQGLKQKNKSLQSQKAMQKLGGLKKKALQQFNQSPTLINLGDQDDSGSQSQPQGGQISQKQRNPQTGYPKPQYLKRFSRDQHKGKPIKITTKHFSSTQSNLKQVLSSKMKSQVFVQEELPKKLVDINSQNYKMGSTILIQNDKPRNHKVQIKIANSVNTFQLDTLRASSLYQKNVRVHSITRNNFDNNSTERSKKVINPFVHPINNNNNVNTPQQDKEGRMRINLIHGRQGAQYRRVRKLAQQNMKKDVMIEDNGKIVKQLHGSNLNNHLELQSNQGGVAPKFYPVSQQRTRRASLQAYIKRQPRLEQFKRISINGDELNVRCMGKHVYF